MADQDTVFWGDGPIYFDLAKGSERRMFNQVSIFPGFASCVYTPCGKTWQNLTFFGGRGLGN
jgi:hypothetical protein